MNLSVHPEDYIRAKEVEEIDLLELFERLWQGKRLIGGIVLLGALLGLVVLKLLPSYYSIEATIDVLPTEQFRLLNPSQIGSSEYQVESPDAKKIYERVLLQANSTKSLKDFWQARTGQALDLGADSEENGNLNAFMKFQERFTVSSQNTKTPDNLSRKLSLYFESRQEGTELLSDYIDFINHYTSNEILARLKDSYTVSLAELEADYKIRSLNEEKKLADVLMGLRESLKVAETLGVRDIPFKDLENIQLKILDEQSYLLGTKYLNQRIDILVERQGKSLAPYSVELRNMENWKEMMTADLRRLGEQKGVRMFSIVNVPEASIKPIKPNKLLIFIGLLCLLFIVAATIVLLMSSLKARNQAIKTSQMPT